MRRIKRVQSTTWLLLSGFVSLCLVSALLFAITVVLLRSAAERDEMHRIDVDMKVAWRLLHELGADVKLVNGRLYAGDLLLNDDTALVDEIKSTVGGTATIFQGDRRVATNVLDREGRRGTGTVLADPAVRDTVLTRQLPFRGRVSVLGKEYYAGYDPIFDRFGTLVGVLYVGTPAADLLAAVNGRIMLLVGLPSGAILLIGIMFCVIGRKLVGQINARQRSLEAARAQLDTALDSMANGLTVWDRDQRLVLANARFAEILGFPPDRVRAGMSFKEFLALRHAFGTFGDLEFDAVYEKRLALLSRQEAVSFVDTLPNNRTVRVTQRPTEDGGRVTTYEDMTEQQAASTRISFMAHYDSLTGLPNRVLFDQRLQEALDAAGQHGAAVAVFGLDLDRFKPVNDTYGHAVGDKLLMAVAKRLQGLLRDTDVAARFGGDEFAVMLPLAQEADLACLATAERIVTRLSEPFTIDDHALNIGVSIGIALFPADGDTGEELQRCADIAMYRAKEAGRSTFRVFEPSMDEALQARRSLERDLRAALDEGVLELHYQPLVCCQTGTAQGYEALLRWQHPTRGAVPPSVFVPLAEETGLILRLGQWVMETACRDAAGWVEPAMVAVNLSPLQFRQPDLAATVLNTLSWTGLDPSRLEIEITEGILMENPERAVETLGALRDAGVRVSLDDFGTGYSSLSYLRQFPLDKIKIDKSFIMDLASDPQSASIVEALVTLAHTLDLTVTAEGVETSEQLAALQRHLCDQVQGFLLGRPSPNQRRTQIAAPVPENLVA